MNQPDIPKTPDDEIYEILDLYENYLSCRTPSLTVDQALTKLKARERRIATEARIDELTKNRRWVEKLAEYADEKEVTMNEYDDRIYQLKNNPMPDETKGGE